MTVIKRNGSEVTFDITKIIAAITKANESVDESIRMHIYNNDAKSKTCNGIHGAVAFR